MDLFSDHTLALHHRPAIFFPADLYYFFNGLCSRFCPYHFSSTAAEIELKFFQLLIQGLYRTPFYVLCSFTREVQVGELLLAYKYSSIIPSDVEIDLASVFRIACFDRTFFPECFCCIGHFITPSSF